MIRAIAAMDSERGIANDHGIPWQGKIPTDVAFFRSKTINSAVLMGYGWYVEQLKPLPNRRNIVATTQTIQLRPGFEATDDAREFILNAKEDVWVGGGAGLFETTLDLIQELYITKLQASFNCTKFFPDYDRDFQLVSESDTQTENGISFSFCVYRRNQK